MSRRQHTTLIVQVRLPMPVGKTQAQTLEWLKRTLTEGFNVAPNLGDVEPFHSPATLVKLIGRETNYL